MLQVWLPGAHRLLSFLFSFYIFLSISLSLYPFPDLSFYDSADDEKSCLVVYTATHKCQCVADYMEYLQIRHRLPLVINDTLACSRDLLLM